ncbi:SRPBCC family protein [Neobacillus mesonae]|nr:SRPBCC family protein [Neobacillus mesonae]
MDGMLKELNGVRIISFERYLKHPMEKVWQAITTPERIADWLTAQAEFELIVGGKITLRWENGDIVNGEFLQINPPYELAFTWVEQASGDSVVRWKLREEGEGCRVHLTHTFNEASMISGFLAGWHVHLDVLDQILQDRLIDFPWERVKEFRNYYDSKMSLKGGDV